MIRFCIYIIILISFIFSLSDAQLEEIRLKTENINLAPPFNLRSIKSNDFPEIKSLIISIANANRVYKENNNNFSIEIELLINEGLVNIKKQILDSWTFELGQDNIETKAISKNNQLSIIYNFIEDSFSFIVSDENLLLKDGNISLESLRGKVVLINFWATWCGPCRLEIPDLNALYQTYNEKGFEILGISTDDSKAQLIKFINAYNIFYPILYEDRITMSKLQMEYGVFSIPLSILINKKGEIIRIYQGAILKQFDPRKYTDLVIQIENALLTTD